MIHRLAQDPPGKRTLPRFGETRDRGWLSSAKEALARLRARIGDKTVDEVRAWVRDDCGNVGDA